MNNIKEANRERIAQLKADKAGLISSVLSNIPAAHTLDLKDLYDDRNLSKSDQWDIRCELAKRGKTEYLPKIFACGYSVRSSLDSQGANTVPSGVNFRGWGLRTKSGSSLKAGDHVVWFASSEIAQAFNIENYGGEYFVDFLNLQF